MDRASDGNEDNWRPCVIALACRPLYTFALHGFCFLASTMIRSRFGSCPLQHRCCQVWRIVIDPSNICGAFLWIPPHPRTRSLVHTATRQALHGTKSPLNNAFLLVAELAGDAVERR